MAEYISVSKISNYVEKEVTIKGWVYNRTDKGKLVFLLVRDGSGFLQCVAFKGDLAPEVFEQVSKLPQESSVIITGSVREDKRAPGIPGGYELGVKQIEVVQEAGLDYPMSLKDHGPDFALGPYPEQGRGFDFTDDANRYHYYSTPGQAAFTAVGVRLGMVVKMSGGE